jgi:hypothetical protein
MIGPSQGPLPVNTTLTINRLPWASGRRLRARREHRNFVWVDKNLFLQVYNIRLLLGSLEFTAVLPFFFYINEGLPSGWRSRPAETENICQNVLDLCEKTPSIANRRNWRLVCSRNKRLSMKNAVDWAWMLWATSLMIDMCLMYTCHVCLYVYVCMCVCVCVRARAYV